MMMLMVLLVVVMGGWRLGGITVLFILVVCTYFDLVADFSRLHIAIVGEPLLDHLSHQHGTFSLKGVKRSVEMWEGEREKEIEKLDLPTR